MISESEFLGKFEGVRQTGGGWIARCPAHGDDNPSLLHKVEFSGL